jgi:hypothetical protein
MTARVPTNLRFCVCVSMHQSGQSIERNVKSSVKITKAAQCPQMDGSPGFGWVDLLSDQRSEWAHSGQCHIGVFFSERSIPPSTGLRKMDVDGSTPAIRGLLRF